MRTPQSFLNFSFTLLLVAGVVVTTNPWMFFGVAPLTYASGGQAVARGHGGLWWSRAGEGAAGLIPDVAPTPDPAVVLAWCAAAWCTTGTRTYSGTLDAS